MTRTWSDESVRFPEYPSCILPSISKFISVFLLICLWINPYIWSCRLSDQRPKFFGNWEVRRPSKTSCPLGWGGVKQKWKTADGGSAPKQDVHLWRIWANILRFGLRRHPFTVVRVAKYVAFRTKYVALSRDMGGVTQTNDVGQGGWPKNHFLLGRLG